jgi:V/A-type H+-transporting ATPase subunit E
MGLEAIIDKIESDAAARIAEIEARAAEQEREILERSRREAERRSEEILERGRRRAELVKEQVDDMARLEIRKRRLELKQRLLDEVFRDAVAELRKLNGDDYRGLVRALIESSGLSGEYELVTSAAEAEHLDEAFLDSFEEPKLSPAGEHRELSGGFILRRGRREFNFTFTALTRSLRRELEKRLLEVLGLDGE